MKMNRNKEFGITVLELLVGLALASILLSIGAPLLSEAKNKSLAETVQNMFVKDLNAARTIAVENGENISVCASENGTSCSDKSWSVGWLIYKGEIPIGDQVPEDDIYASYERDLPDVELSVINESGESVSSIHFTSQGFNAQDNSLTAFIQVAGERISNQSIYIQRSGRVGTTETAEIDDSEALSKENQMSVQQRHQA